MQIIALSLSRKSIYIVGTFCWSFRNELSLTSYEGMKTIKNVLFLIVMTLQVILIPGQIWTNFRRNYLSEGENGPQNVKKGPHR